MIASILRISTLSLLLSLCYLYGCAGTPDTGTLNPFLKQFEHEVGTSTKGISLYFKKLPPRVAGRCTLGVKIIQIDPDFFITLTYHEQKALMFHEIAHCACNIYKHAPTRNTYCGSSLMDKSMKSAWCYRNNWDVYMKDLRKRCK